MAEDQTQTQQEQGQQQQGSLQSQYDSKFFDQMIGAGVSSPSSSSFGWEFTRQIVEGYHDQAEQTLRQARRITEQAAQYLLFQQTTTEIARMVTPVVARQVIEHLRSNPQLVKELVSNTK